MTIILLMITSFVQLRVDNYVEKSKETLRACYQIITSFRMLMRKSHIGGNLAVPDFLFTLDSDSSQFLRQTLQYPDC